MDVNDLRTLLLVLAFVSFVGIVVWTYSRRRKHDFEEAARLPLRDEDVDKAQAPENTKEKR